jgi:N-acetylneuraminate lyase
MRSDGTLNLDAVEKQAEHLARHGLSAVFIGGTTGESHSLTVEERRQLTRRWAGAIRGTSLKLVVHVGHNCLADAQVLAADAQQAGAHAIAALAPSYFRPADVSALVDWCADIARAASSLPFYFYDIPSWTHVELPMVAFLEQGRERIPTLTGLKFTNADLALLQECLRLRDGAFNILYGNDESLLAALALGIRGAVGSTYNFAAPISHRVVRGFEQHDFKTAQQEQARTVTLVRLLSGYGFLAASKAVMGLLGVDCGPVRAPLRPLTAPQIAELRGKLAAVGFFEWIHTSSP